MKKDGRLTDGVITIRPYLVSDIDSVYEAVRESMPELSVWMSWCHPDHSIEETKTWIASQPDKWEKREEYNFVISYNGGALYLGGCGFGVIDRGCGIADLGYWVRTSQTNKGIAIAATLLLAQFAFNGLGLNRVELTIAVDNQASLRVADKAGAIREGILRNRVVKNDTPSDAVVFSLIPQDLAWRNGSAKAQTQFRQP
jgi:ribosomal-protein-serine acetyltransferase